MLIIDSLGKGVMERYAEEGQITTSLKDKLPTVPASKQAEVAKQLNTEKTKNRQEANQNQINNLNKLISAIDEKRVDMEGGTIDELLSLILEADEFYSSTDQEAKAIAESRKITNTESLLEVAKSLLVEQRRLQSLGK